MTRFRSLYTVEYAYSAINTAPGGCVSLRHRLVQIASPLAVLASLAMSTANAQVPLVNTIPLDVVGDSAATDTTWSGLTWCRGKYRGARDSVEKLNATATKAALDSAAISPDSVRILRQAADDLDSFGCLFKALTLRTPHDADLFFGGLEVGNVIALTLGGDNAALYTELLSDNLFLAAIGNLGYARMGFAAQVAASSDSTATTVDQFFQGGGNAIVYASRPLLVYLNFVGVGLDEPKMIRRLNTFATIAFGADIPELSTATTDHATNVRLGLQGDFTWSANNDVFRLFILGDGGYVYGSQAYYQISPTNSRTISFQALVSFTPKGRLVSTWPILSASA